MFEKISYFLKSETVIKIICPRSNYNSKWRIYLNIFWMLILYLDNLGKEIQYSTHILKWWRQRHCLCFQSAQRILMMVKYSHMCRHISFSVENLTCFHLKKMKNVYQSPSTNSSCILQIFICEYMYFSTLELNRCDTSEKWNKLLWF